MKHQNEIIIYSPDTSININVLIEDDTVRLSQMQMAELFDRNQSVISRHINNIFKEGELTRNSVYANFAYTANDGKTYEVEHYNLDMIISVGYRVKSKRGVQFRIWATKILKEYMLKGYAISQRIEHLEQRVGKTEEQIGFFIKTSLPLKEGIFYEGQIFDAYVFVSDLVKSAKKSIILMDNYIDESVLNILSKRSKGVTATIYTDKIPEPLKLDLQKLHEQYPEIAISTYRHSHDRFLIIDETVYHIGASIKDLGKKLFAFSKMEIPPQKL